VCVPERRTRKGVQSSVLGCKVFVHITIVLRCGFCAASLALLQLLLDVLHHLLVLIPLVRLRRELGANAHVVGVVRLLHLAGFQLLHVDQAASLHVEGILDGQLLLGSDLLAQR